MCLTLILLHKRCESWGDTVIDVLDEIYCKSLITIASIINEHPGLMLTHSLSISSILQPFQAAQERCEHRPSLTTVDFIALWGGGLWMTPVLGPRSHTELEIKLRAAGSQPCPLIHVFLFLSFFVTTLRLFSLPGCCLMEHFALLIFIP